MSSVGENLEEFGVRLKDKASIEIVEKIEWGKLNP